MMKGILRLTGLFALVFFWGSSAWAQPANDLCSGAIELTVYNSEEEAIPVEGDTRETTDGALDGIPVCSGNFYRDDVWYVFTTPSDFDGALAVQFNIGEVGTDVPDIGVAMYSSCDATMENQPFFCGNSPANGRALACVGPDQTVYVRVWSAAGDADNWQDGQGTFRISVFPNEFEGTSNDDVNILWGDLPGQGDFDGGLNDWTAVGISCNGTPAENALWTPSTSGQGFYIFGDGGVSPIKSRTFCNGSAIFDSGFLHFGTAGTAGSGTCPWDQHEGALVSPSIDLSEFDVAGVSLLFNQSMQRFVNGLHFVDYSIDDGVTWIENQINTEKTYLSTNPSTGDGYYNEEFRMRLFGAEGASTLRIRFRFQGGAYWWVIDDVRVIETEANNMRAQSNFFAIVGHAMMPTDQLRPNGVLIDVYNAGAADQTNVNVRHTVVNTDTEEVIYDEVLPYGTVASDALIENRLFPELLNLPAVPANYTATYEVTQDSIDFDSTDNVITYNFSVGGNTFALEDGFTRSVAVANGIYDDGAPLSYAYGNYFFAVNDATLESVVWGVANPDDMAGQTVQIYLLQWTDTNGDQIAASNERRFVGLGSYTFQGDEGENVILETVLENFDDPAEPIELQAGFGYIAIIEYQASTSADPQFFLLASEARNYTAQQLAIDTAFAYGLVDFQAYYSVLGFSPDGNIANIDYEVKELNPNDTRIFFGNDIVPLVRLVTKEDTVRVEDLSADNIVTVFPNPAVDHVQVKLDFTKSFENVMLRLVDNAGRIVYNRILPNLPASHIERINLKDLAPGTYHLSVATSEGQRTIPVVVIK